MDWRPVLTIIVGLGLSWVGLVLVLWLVRPRTSRLRDLIALVPDLLRLVRSLLADPSSPPGVRISLLFLLVWLLSPIDLIPEFVPVLGPLDDIVVAVLVLRYVSRRLGTRALRERWTGSDATFQLLEGILGAG